VRVLLAEDHPVNQFVVRRMLERAGITVDLAEDGAKAVAATAERRYDAILMDMQMPVMDGLEAMRLIRATPGPNQSTRIIGLTAAVGPEYEAQCREAGADDYLPKPVVADALLRSLGVPPRS
jgi:CheY-like chemotaxis protein